MNYGMAVSMAVSMNPKNGWFQNDSGQLISFSRGVLWTMGKKGQRPPPQELASFGWGKWHRR